MTIQWISPLQEIESKVFYKKIDDENTLQQTGSTQPLPNSKNYLLHRVELTDLIPDTYYEFKTNEDNSTKALLFQTMPRELKEPIRFVVGGDMYHHGETPKSMQSTCLQAAKTNPRFAMLGGDLAYAFNGARSEEKIERWIDWVRTWSSCMRSDEGRLIPVISAIGNHDIYGHFDQSPAQAQVFWALFPMPGKQIYNVLDFGSYLTFFILDSGHANPVAGAQTSWLKEILQSRSDRLHRFAIYHVPAYPSIRDFNNPQSAVIRKSWVPLFEQGGVHTVFEHHDHAYKRTIPLLAGKFNPKGIVYVGDGAWSVDKPRPAGFKKRTYLAKFKSSRHFILMTVDQDKRIMKSIDDKGNVIDEYISYIPVPAPQNVPVPVQVPSQVPVPALTMN